MGVRAEISKISPFMANHGFHCHLFPLIQYSAFAKTIFVRVRTLIFHILRVGDSQPLNIRKQKMTHY